MLRTFVKAGETYRNALYPAIIESLRRVLEFYSLTGIDKVYFNGDAEVSKQLFSDIDSGVRADRQTDFKLINKLYIVTEEQPSVFNNGYGNAQRTITNRPVWKTDDDKVMIIPTYDGREITVDVNAHFRTRQEARNFRNSLEQARNRQANDLNFNAHVHYPLNLEIIYFLTTIHKRLVNAGQVTDEFAPWFFKNACMPFTTITNPAGNNTQVVLQQRRDEIGIFFEEPTIALTRKSNEYLGRYEVSFRYKFYWNEQTDWDLRYPLMIYQQPLDQMYMPKPQLGYRNGFNPHAFVELGMINLLLKSRTKHSPYYQRIPEYDMWVPPGQRWLDTQLTIAITVKDEANVPLMNIVNDIPNWTWDDDFLEHMLKYRENLFTRHEDIFHIQVYSDDILVLPEQLSMDEEGNILLNRKPTMGNVYRVVIFVDCNLKEFSDQNNQNILDDENYLYTVIPKLFPWYKWDKFPVNTPNDLARLIDESGLGDMGALREPVPMYMMNNSLAAYEES